MLLIALLIISVLYIALVGHYLILLLPQLCGNFDNGMNSGAHLPTSIFIIANITNEHDLKKGFKW